MENAPTHQNEIKEEREPNMRMSRLFSQTLRDVTADVEVASHQLLLRAGFIRPLASGIFSYLPLAQRSMRKIEDIIRCEIDAIGGQEITMPVVHPAELWQRTGRWYAVGTEMGRFQDKNERDMVLAMTHEEVVADLVSREIKSYKQLPQLVYHIQTKWRDDPRPRSGLIRVREFTMKDSYSLDADWEGLEKQYRAHYQQYFNIFHRCGLDVLAVRSDTGMMGGELAHEYMYLTPIGEDTLLLCDGCEYSANRQIATFAKQANPEEEPAAPEKIATPNTTTIEELTALLDIPAHKTAKALFLMATIGDGRDKKDAFVLAVIRGDMEVNETKLANAVGALEMWPARDEEIRAIGAEPGYGSPIGVEGALVVVDDSVASSPNLVAGANEPGYHLANVNHGRDYTANVVADIASARQGDGCPNCERGTARIARSGSGQHLPARHQIHRGTGRGFPRRRGQGAASRHGVLRDRRGAAAGLYRRGVPRRRRLSVAHCRRALPGPHRPPRQGRRRSARRGRATLRRPRGARH